MKRLNFYGLVGFLYLFLSDLAGDGYRGGGGADSAFFPITKLIK